MNPGKLPRAASSIDNSHLQPKLPAVRRTIHFIFAAALLPWGLALAAEQAPAQPAAPKPTVTRVDEHTLRIGKITFRPDTREIRIPTRVNMTEGLLEFALVRTGGKTHESLLVTDAKGLNINLALKLLHYKASEELFPLFEEDGSLSDKFPEVPEAIRKAARTRLSVEWKDGQTVKRAPLNEWIGYAATDAVVPMPKAPWVYGGSYVLEGKFASDTTGDLVAIFTTRNAIINYAGKDHDNDDVWIPAPKRVPPVDSEVTLIIAPYTDPDADAKPADSSNNPPAEKPKSDSSTKQTKTTS